MLRAGTVKTGSTSLIIQEVAATPILTRPNDWRMLPARCEPRSADTRIRSLVLQPDYSSESTFSTAFNRKAGNRH